MTTTHPIETRNDRWQGFIPPVCAPTEFLLTYDARQVYLRLATETGVVIGLLKMESLDTPSRWALTLNLKPGMYRYRYYADCGRVTTYVYPGEVEITPRPMDGLDATLCVRAREIRRTLSRRHRSRCGRPEAIN